MYIEVPKGATLEELYQWAMELCEKLNRELNSTQEDDNVL